MNIQNLTGKLAKHKTVLAIALGLAVTAVLGYTSIASVIAQSNYDPSTSGWNSNFTRPNIQGSVNVQDNIISSVKVKFADAANTAATAVGDGTVMGGRLAVEQNYLVYEFMVLDGNNKTHKVIVDAGDGKVLYTSEGFDMDIQMLVGGHGPGPWSNGKSYMHHFPH